MNSELLTHPATLTAAAWLVSRLQILIEVMRRTGTAFRLGRYLALRWRQIIGSAGSTVAAYALLVVTDTLDPINALMAGAAADQVIDRFAGFLARRSRPSVPVGEAPSDITILAQTMREDSPDAPDTYTPDTYTPDTDATKRPGEV